MSKELAMKFFKEGLEYKQKGSYDLARDCFMRAISYDPSNPEVHYANGKLNFLMGNYITSLNSYLAYTHLNLNKRIGQLNGEIDFPDAEASESFYENLSDDAKRALPHKAASYILEDGDICNHVAHAYIGSQNVTDPRLVLNLKVYHATLVGKLLLDMALESHKTSLEEFDKTNFEIFIPQGRMLLLENIAWDEIESEDVLKIYFS